MSNTLDSLETNTQKNMLWLAGLGHKGMNYPRWDGVRYCAKQLLAVWNEYHSGQYYAPPDSQRARIVIAFQPFSGLRGEWVEANIGTWASPIMAKGEGK